jgi:hypothetical protein
MSNMQTNEAIKVERDSMPDCDGISRGFAPRHAQIG